MQVVLVVAFYMVAALVMVFVNKLVLLTSPKLPILFMFFQSYTTVLLLTLTSLFLPSLISIPPLFSQPLSTTTHTAKKLAPLILVDAAGFVFNALCLRDVEAAFYQVARGLVLPLTITAVAITSRTAPRLPVVFCATVVTIGFLLGVTWTPGLPASAVISPRALLYGFLSSLSIAVHAVLIKSSLAYVHGSPTQLSYWANFGAAIFLIALALLRGEVTEFYYMASQGTESGILNDGAPFDMKTFLYGNIVTGIFGFLISVAGILSVKVTSPVTHMFSSAARSVLQVLLGVKIFGDVLTTQRAMSVLTILCGTLLYTWAKAKESPPPSAPAEVQGTKTEQNKLMEEKDMEMEEGKARIE